MLCWWRPATAACIRGDRVQIALRILQQHAYSLLSIVFCRTSCLVSVVTLFLCAFKKPKGKREITSGSSRSRFEWLSVGWSSPPCHGMVTADGISASPGLLPSPAWLPACQMFVTSSPEQSIAAVQTYWSTTHSASSQVRECAFYSTREL